MIFLITIGFWILQALKDCYAFFIFACGYCGFLWFRFKKVNACIIFVLLACISLFPINQCEYPRPGLYRVYEVKNNYVLARNNKGVDVMVYGIDDPSYYDVYSLSHFKKITSQNNVGVFNFASYINKKGVYYSCYASGKDLVERETNLKSRLFLAIKRLNHPIAMKILYGWNVEDGDFINRLGMPILAFLSMLQQRLRRYSWGDLVSFLIGCFFLMCFSMPLSLLRWLCFHLAKMIWKDWKYAFSFSFFLFWLLQPQSVWDFTFVFPTLMSFCSHWIVDKNVRYIANKFILFCCMLLYFHKIDWIAFFLFPVLRKLYASMIVLLIPSFFFKGLQKVWNIFSLIPSLEWHYLPGFLFCVGIAWFMFGLLKSKKQTCYKAMLACLCLCFFQPFLDPTFSVYMIDIGQGDCTLIVEPFLKSAVMIDVGQNLHRYNVELFVEPFLKQKHISHLDALIVTHNDFDHSGGVESLQSRIPIDTIIKTSQEKVPVSYPFYSLLPKRTISDENSKSIINYFSYDCLDYLWTGDAGIAEELAMLEQYDLKNVDVLKLGHHGSKTSSCFEFLDATRPILGLVSAGENNRYGHPDSNVMKNCHDLGIHTLATKDVGMIQIKTWHRLAYFKTANHLLGNLMAY